MKVESVGESIVLTCSPDEVSTLVGCMNEALDAVQGWEFHARLGVGRDEVRALIRALNKVL